MPELITITELAAIIHKSRLSVGNDVTRNPACLPPFAKIGNKILFYLAKVEAWIEAQFTNKSNESSNKSLLETFARSYFYTKNVQFGVLVKN